MCSVVSFPLIRGYVSFVRACIPSCSLLLIIIRCALFCVNVLLTLDSVKLLWSFQLTNSKVFLLVLIGSVDSDHRSTPVKGIQAALPPLTAASAMIFLQVCQSGLTLLHCSFLRSAAALHSDLSAYSMLCCLLAEHHPHSEEAVKAAPAPRKRLRP